MDLVSGRLTLAAPALPDTELQAEPCSAGVGERPWSIGAAVRRDGGSSVGPEVVLGQGCELGGRVQIAHSVLWPRVRLGDGATVERSIITSDVTLPAGAHVVGKIVTPSGMTDL